MSLHSKKQLQQNIRNQHISKVLFVLQEDISLSRAELSRKTGLAKSSMSSIIEEMLALGFILEMKPKPDGVGKPSTQLVLNTNCRRAIGVEINPGFVAVILANLVGDIVWEGVAPLEPGSEKEIYLNSVEGLIDLAVNKAQQEGIQLLGICVGVPGSVNPKTGSVYSPSSLGWEDFPLQKNWMKKYGLPVVVDTEANLGAIGEHRFGCAKDIDTFLYINQSFGFRRSIGLAMMLNGELWRGMEGRAGRIGHMVIDPNGPQCNCGQYGCWRVMVSDEVELQHAINALKEGRESILSEYSQDGYDGLTVDRIHQAAIQGDALAREVLGQRIKYTELAISNLINIFDPSVVVTAFSYTTINKPKVNEILAELGNVIDEITSEVELNTRAERRHATHEQKSVLLGAASLLLNQFMENPKGIEQE